MKKMRVRLANGAEQLLWSGKFVIDTPSGCTVATADNLVDAMTGAAHMWRAFHAY